MSLAIRLAPAGALVLACLIAAPAGAAALLPHKASYRLALDGSKPSGQLEELSGEIRYEITGDACTGFSTDTRQASIGSTGEGDPVRQSVTSKSWEDGEAKSYRFTSVSSSGEGDEKVEAKVERQGREALKVTVIQPDPGSFDLKGDILLPTEHVRRVLAAAAAGETTLQARVYDGASDPSKVYDTLAIIGRASTDESRLAAPAREALKGVTFYPITVSYFEGGGGDRAPAYVMSMSLYENGVVGGLKIDYGRFALVGAMATFEALPAPGGCSN